jgi:hypothetical protein
MQLVVEMLALFFFLTTEMLAVDLAPNVYAELIQTELR